VPNGVDRLGWVTEMRVARLAGVPRSTLSSWERDSLFEPPSNKAFRARHLVLIVIISALRGELTLNATRQAVSRLRLAKQLDDLVDRGLAIGDGGRFDLVIEPDTAAVVACFDDASLLAAIRDDEKPRTSIVIPLGAVLTRALFGFDSYAERGPAPKQVQRGRPRSARLAENPQRQPFPRGTTGDSS
jgi:DNA-binding transcriptional MerR regulator